jgi:tRNA (cmo5U34)-methyltransferase
MSNHTKDVFEVTASTYDADRSRLIPRCDAFFRWAVDLIPPTARRMLELGAGSGLLTMLVRQRFPHASIHLIDFSGSMLELAKRRLGDDPLITYDQADYLEVAFPPDLDAVISSLSIHHLDHAHKRVVFRKIYNALGRAGAFVNAEQVAGPTPELDRRYNELWLAQVRMAGATTAQIDAALRRMREDRCAPVALQLQWMREAGFADADCWYKENRFAVMAGTRV